MLWYNPSMRHFYCMIGCQVLQHGLQRLVVLRMYVVMGQTMLSVPADMHAYMTALAQCIKLVI